MESRSALFTRMTAAVAGLWLATGVGCATFTVPPVPSVTKVFEKEEPVVAPGSVAVVWTTTVLEKATAPATRGFGGVVTFYGADRAKPVRVSGELTIYAYDELSHKPDDATPDRKYVFTKEQLEKHCGKGPAGPAYHIWIPWDEIGGPRRETCLIVRLDPVEGKAVMTNPTHAVLPGPKDERDRLMVSRTSQPTCVSCVAAAAGTASAGGAPPSTVPARRTETATFDLPGREVHVPTDSPGKVPKSEPRPQESGPVGK